MPRTQGQVDIFNQLTALHECQTGLPEVFVESFGTGPVVVPPAPFNTDQGQTDIGLGPGRTPLSNEVMRQLGVSTIAIPGDPTVPVVDVTGATVGAVLKGTDFTNLRYDASGTHFHFSTHEMTNVVDQNGKNVGAVMQGTDLSSLVEKGGVVSSTGVLVGVNSQGKLIGSISNTADRQTLRVLRSVHSTVAGSAGGFNAIVDGSGEQVGSVKEEFSGIDLLTVIWRFPGTEIVHPAGPARVVAFNAEVAARQGARASQRVVDDFGTAEEAASAAGLAASASIIETGGGGVAASSAAASAAASSVASSGGSNSQVRSAAVAAAASSGGSSEFTDESLSGGSSEFTDESLSIVGAAAVAGESAAAVYMARGRGVNEAAAAAGTAAALSVQQAGGGVRVAASAGYSAAASVVLARGGGDGGGDGADDFTATSWPDASAILASSPAAVVGVGAGGGAVSRGYIFAYQRGVEVGSVVEDADLDAIYVLDASVAIGRGIPLREGYNAIMGGGGPVGSLRVGILLCDVEWYAVDESQPTGVPAGVPAVVSTGGALVVDSQGRFVSTVVDGSVTTVTVRHADGRLITNTQTDTARFVGGSVSGISVITNSLAEIADLSGSSYDLESVTSESDGLVTVVTGQTSESDGLVTVVTASVSGVTTVVTTDNGVHVSTATSTGPFGVGVPGVVPGVQTFPDGTSVVTAVDGSKVKTNSDGSSVAVSSDGSVVTTDARGSVSLEYRLPPFYRPPPVHQGAACRPMDVQISLPPLTGREDSGGGCEERCRDAARARDGDCAVVRKRLALWLKNQGCATVLKKRPRC